jgi:membrane protease subunit HflK
VAKFRAMLNEYRKAKDVTKKRLYLEAMEEILPGVKKYIVPNQEDGNLLNLLNLTGE